VRDVTCWLGFAAVEWAEVSGHFLVVWEARPEGSLLTQHRVIPTILQFHRHKHLPSMATAFHMEQSEDTAIILYTE
jgi:hypothetical protein